MSNNKKCPVCGNDEFIDIENPFQIWGDAQMKTPARFQACTSCGLVLMFDTESVQKTLEKEVRKDKIRKEIKELQDQIPELERQKDLLPLKIKELEEERTNPNRTVARDTELVNEIQNLNNQLSGIDNQIRRIRDKIKTLDYHLQYRI